MLKLSKKLLALSVSVVLSASALLAGCGKVEGDADDKAVKAESISESAEAALDTVGNAAENIYDMFTGKTDKAYSGEVKLSLGKPLADELGVGDIKDIIFTSDVKAKGGSVETIFGLTYGKDEIISADMIRDDETGNVYIGFEQLAPGYLMVSGEDVDAYIAEMTEDLFDVELDLTGHKGTVTDTDFEIPEISEEELEEWLAPYEQAIKDNAPAGTDKDKATGEIDGIKYTLDVKGYTVSGYDAIKVITPVVEQLKKDEKVLSLIDEYGATEGVTRQELIDLLDEMLESMNSGSDLDETVSFDVYYQDDSFAGISFNIVDDNEYWRDTEGLDMFWYETETELCGKLEIIDESIDKDDPEWSYNESIAMKGSAKIDNGATDVSISIEADDAKISFKIDDFQIVDEDSGAFTGTATFSYSMGDHSLVATMESKSSSSKLDLSADVKIDGEKYISVSVTGKETKASDVKIPSKNIYDVNDEDQLEAYGATVDTEKFMEDVKDALGEDLYNYLFFGSSSSYYDDWDYDYDDWDYDYNDDFLGGWEADYYEPSYSGDYTGIGKVIYS